MRRTLVPSALALILVAGLATRAAAYEAMAVTDGGTLSGTVKFQGTAPPPAKLEVTKDPEVCGKEKTSPDLVVGSDGALANVVVTVKAQKGKKLEPPAQNPTFDQKTCDYKVELWQEKLGKKTEKVSIKPKEETKVSWSMTKA